MRQAFVFGDLLRLQHLVEIFAEGLVFNIPKNQTALGNLKVGGTFLFPVGVLSVRLSLDLLLFGLVVNRQARFNIIGYRLQEALQRGTISVLGFVIEGVLRSARR